MPARRTALLAALALVGAGFAPLAHAVTAATPLASATTRLSNTVVPRLERATLLRPSTATDKVQVIAGIARPHEAEEEALAAAIYDPKSPAYHRFLTPAQYASRFGVERATFDRISSWLTRAGMRVVYAPSNRGLVTVEGTVAQAEKTFDVTLSEYSLGGFEFRAHPKPALVPAGVVGLKGLQTASRLHTAQEIAAAQPKPVAKSPAQQDFCEFGPCIGELTPRDLWKVYGIDGMGSTGAGVKAAIIGTGKTRSTIDGLRRFESANGFSTTPVRSYYVANSKTDDSGAGEWQIDSQAIKGMAPDIQEIDFYFSEDLNTTTNAIAYWADDPNGPVVGNMSIGGCEALNVALGSPAVDQPVFRQNAIEGRSLFNSTGDMGGSCAIFNPVQNTNGVQNSVVPGAGYPSTSQYLVAVGGTVLYTEDGTGDRLLEYTWTHSGGGPSYFMPAPAWQRPIGLIKNPCVTDDALNPVTSYVVCRATPDVSALSGDILSNGYTVYKAGSGTFGGGGTSLSAPLWAGMWARVEGASRSGLGLASPLLYRTATGGKLGGFYDIEVGSNGQWNALPRTSGNPTGWDFTNGLGVPVLSQLTKDIVGSTDAQRSNVALPAEREDDVQPGGGGGGGGSTAACASANGQYVDDEGDTIDFGVVTADVDLKGASIAYDGTSLVFKATVVNLGSTKLPSPVPAAAQAQVAKEFDWRFSVGGTSYEVEAIRKMVNQPAPGARGVLYTYPAYARVSVTVDVTFDYAKNIVTAKVPVAAFNQAAGKALAAGSKLTGIEVQGDYLPETGDLAVLPLIMDTIDAVGCPAVVL